MRLHVILHFFVVTPKSDPFRPFDKTSFLQTFFFSALTNITVPGLGQGVWSEPAGCPWKGGWKKVTVVSRERNPGWHAKTGALGPSTLITRTEFGLDVVFFFVLHSVEFVPGHRKLLAARNVGWWCFFLLNT